MKNGVIMGTISLYPWDPYFDPKSKFSKMKIPLYRMSSWSSMVKEFCSTLLWCLRRDPPIRTAISSQQNGGSRKTKRGWSNFDPVFEFYLTTLCGVPYSTYPVKTSKFLFLRTPILFFGSRSSESGNHPETSWECPEHSFDESEAITHSYKSDFWF